ncbi:MAG TPA: class I SAM-dependent methyltransferase [Candidatus Acidoferrum sp.]|jgi:2-polyprenyl-3-methyl-5-hydroxy-6-metoxy-1,4-benzoquinol methylase
MKPWNDLSGDWQELASPTQAPRYQVIAEMIGRLRPRGSVLDVGCGEAILFDYLPRDTKYLGIEPSGMAAEASRVKCGGERIVNTTGEEFADAGTRWDCIVFNEVLYYTSNPSALLDKYSKLLSSEGIVIVSIYQKPGKALKTRVLRWLDRSRPIGNVRCTAMIHAFMARRGWHIEDDKSIEILGTSLHWQIRAAKPH